jgi:predicted phage terminase large subunit-like protein
LPLDELPSLEAIRAERERRNFRRFVERVRPRYVWYRHCALLADVLQRVADGELSRVMIFMPPRHGKSELTSRLFPAFYLHRHPERFVGLCSYGQDMANSLSRAARENYLAAGGTIKADAAQIKHWEVPGGGGFWCAGVGGPITGKGFELGVIDDPLKNEKEALSETIRERHKEWYDATFTTREHPGGAIVVIQTRWHEDDLSGWLLKQEREEEDPERWHIVNFPALAEAQPQEFPESCTVEPDWREPGDALCPERYKAERLNKSARKNPFWFSALFQQRPTPRSGGFFKLEWFKSLPAASAIAQRVRWWDKAASEDGDWTVGLLMGKTPEGIFFIEDIVRGRWTPGARDRIILDTARDDATRYGNTVEVWQEQEPGASGKSDALAFIKMLAGYPARAEPSSGDKEVRANPFAAQAEAGNVFIVDGPFKRDYLRELATFPKGEFDDQIDASSGAFNKLCDAATLVIY